ncbi:MAG: hypothetical protein ACOZFS_12095 [Thermodesulfobacteriota bacterium]
MKKTLTLATVALFLLSLQPAGAQRQVEPPAVPPMLEGQKPLAQPETREPVASKQPEEAKAKPKAKAKAKTTTSKKESKQTGVKKASPKKASKDLKKKNQKNPKKKRPETGAKGRGGPVVG